MRRIPKVSLGFKELTPSLKVSFGSNVINCLTSAAPTLAEAGGPFPALPVSITELQAANDDLAQAISQALTGNKTAKAALKAKVIAWNNAFTLDAIYVSSVANGDLSVISLSGYNATKEESQPSQKPGASLDFKATINGSSGTIIAGSKKPVPGSRAYVFAAVPQEATVSYNGDIMVVTIADKSIYISANVQKQMEFYNLPSGVPYNVSMYAVNTAGSGPATPGQQVIPQ